MRFYIYHLNADNLNMGYKMFIYKCLHNFYIKSVNDCENMNKIYPAFDLITSLITCLMNGTFYRLVIDISSSSKVNESSINAS